VVERAQAARAQLLAAVLQVRAPAALARSALPGSLQNARTLGPMTLERLHGDAHSTTAPALD